MAMKFNLQISILLISAVFYLHPPPHASADTVCPYPCYPTPTGVPTTTTTTTPPGTNYNYPPPAFVNTPPSTGYLPYPPPSGYGGGYGPPPPDPILPYFPYYFKNGLHKDQPASSSSFSSSSSSIGYHALTIIAWVAAFVLNFYFF